MSYIKSKIGYSLLSLTLLTLLLPVLIAFRLSILNNSVVGLL